MVRAEGFLVDAIAVNWLPNLGSTTPRTLGLVPARVHFSLDPAGTTLSNKDTVATRTLGEMDFDSDASKSFGLLPVLAWMIVLNSDVTLSPGMVLLVNQMSYWVSTAF